MGKDTEDILLTDYAAATITVSHLLHPHHHFEHPNDVVNARHLAENEKRAILASWASDQFAIESIPSLRLYPGTERAVTYDDVLTALKALDREDASPLRRSDDLNSKRRIDLRSLVPLRRRHRPGARKG